MKKKYNVGDRVWFAYDDGSIMGWTITKTHPTSYRDDNGKTVLIRNIFPALNADMTKTRTLMPQ